MFTYIENKNAGKEVSEAIANTEKLMSGYFQKNLEMRTDVGIGSTYDNMTPDELKKALKEAEWKEVDHPDVMNGCRAFVTSDIKGGCLGLMSVKDMPDDTLFLAEDPKNTGKISIAAAGVSGEPAKITFLIIGKDDDQPLPEDKEKPVVFTFHPGEPVRPSLVESKTEHAVVLSKQQVVKMGFALAKVDRNAEGKVLDSLENGYFDAGNKDLMKAVVKDYVENDRDYYLDSSAQKAAVDIDPGMVALMPDPDRDIVVDALIKCPDLIGKMDHLDKGILIEVMENNPEACVFMHPSKEIAKDPDFIEAREDAEDEIADRLMSDDGFIALMDGEEKAVVMFAEGGTVPETVSSSAYAMERPLRCFVVSHDEESGKLSVYTYSAKTDMNRGSKQPFTKLEDQKKGLSAGDIADHIRRSVGAKSIDELKVIEDIRSALDERIEERSISRDSVSKPETR